MRERPGFDAIVGNPPFMGGQKLTGAFGTSYREYLVLWLAGGARGSADLVAYFFLRAYGLLRDKGNFGLLAVNTIAEGDTRQIGLECLVQGGAVIYAAYPNEPWPGRAAVVTSRVHVHKGEWRAERSIFGRSVAFISPFLSDREEWTPKRLKANEGIAFQGSIVLGMGFVVTKEEAGDMIRRNPSNRDVLFPYLNGDDLNSDPEQNPSRWVISFWDWPEERAKKYREPYELVKAKVRPERQRRKPDGTHALRKPLPERWWQYAEKRPGLYHAVGRGHHFERHPESWHSTGETRSTVMVCAEVTKHLGFALVPNQYIYSDRVDVFALQGPLLTISQSSIHEVWARNYSARLETRLKYSPGNAFETFPLPLSDSDSLEMPEYFDTRQQLMRDLVIGLTKLYNRFHDSKDRDSRIEALRDLHRKIDLAVARAYGWDNLDLGHGFHEVPYLPENDRVRFTISEPARIEVLRRLAELNRVRHEQEVAEGLQGVATTATPRTRHAVAVPVPQPALDFSNPSEGGGHGRVASRLRGGDARDPARAILDHLSARHIWYAKADILSATGLGDGEWNKAIADLVARGLVERHGEKRGARYRAHQGSQGSK